MRILEVCPYDIERPGGVQRHVLDLARALGRTGHEVVVLAPGTDTTPAWEQCECYRVLRIGRFREWRMHGTAFEATWASSRELDTLLRLHEERPFDVAHFHTLWTPLLPWQVFRRLAGRVPRRVATFHDTPPPTLSGRITRVAYRLLSRVLSSRLDAAIAVSASPAAHLRLAPSCAFHRLPPVVDLAPLLEIPRPSRDGHAPTLLFIGRLEPRKGVLLLIEAYAQVRRDHPAARLVICGDGELAGAATALAARLAVADAVQFTGRLDEAAKRRLYGEADLFCAPSPYGESYGLVLVEAMAAGLPVVAADNSGYRTVLTGPGAAGLVQPGNVAELAARLSEFLDAPALCRELSTWGRGHALSADVTTRLSDFVDVFTANSPSHLLTRLDRSPLSVLRATLAGYRPRFRHELLTDWASALMYRPLSILLTPIFLPLPPTVITLAGLLIALPLPLLAMKGSGMAVAAMAAVFCVLDCVDGNVARVSGRVSRGGAYTDFVCDLLYRAAFYLAIGLLAEPAPGGVGMASAIGLGAALLAILARACRLYADATMGEPDEIADTARLSSGQKLFAFLSGLDRLAPLLLAAAVWSGHTRWLLVWLLAYSLGDFLSAQIESLGRLKR